MISRKESILQLIDQYTRQALLEGSMNFENCSAHILSIDLNLDRTNISRILNQLHQEGFLIKISGRPTLYLSRKALSDNYPYATIPDKLEAGDNITNFISHSFMPLTSESENRFDMIGGEPDGSLYNSILEVLPALYYPFKDLQIITIRGEYGVGKHHFVTQLFKRGQQIGKFQKNQKILYTDGEMLSSNLLFETGKFRTGNYALISILINRDLPSSILSSFLQQIEFFCQQQNKNLPLVVLMIDRVLTDYSQYYQLTSFNAYFPPLSKRPIREIVCLVLSILQRECDQLLRPIQISKALLLFLSVKNHKENTHRLKNDVLYVLSHSLFHSFTGTNSALVLKETESLKYASQESDSDKVLSEFSDLPEHILLQPNRPNLIEQFIGSNHATQKLLSRSPKYSADISMEDIIINLSPNLDNYTFSICSTSTRVSIGSVLDNTVLSKDPVVYEYVLSIIEQIISHQINSDTLPYINSDASETLSHSTIEKMKRLLLGKNKELDSKSFEYILNLIAIAQNCISDLRLPIIFIMHGEKLADKYALKLNQYYRKRLFFSKDFTPKPDGIQRFYKQLVKDVKRLNRGHGIFFFVDHDPLDKLDSKLFMDTQMMTFTICPLSLVYMQEAIEIIRQGDKNIIPLSSTIVNRKRQHNHFLSEDTLKERKTRATDIHLKQISKLFPTLHTELSFDLIYQLLIHLNSRINIKLNNQLIIDFIFFGNCILEQKLRKKETNREIEPLNAVYDSKLIEIIQEEVNLIDELKSLQFSFHDYLLLHDCIQPHASLSASETSDKDGMRDKL